MDSPFGKRLCGEIEGKRRPLGSKPPDGSGEKAEARGLPGGIACSWGVVSLVKMALVVELRCRSRVAENRMSNRDPLVPLREILASKSAA